MKKKTRKKRRKMSAKTNRETELRRRKILIVKALLFAVLLAVPTIANICGCIAVKKTVQKFEKTIDKNCAGNTCEIR